MKRHCIFFFPPLSEPIVKRELSPYSPFPREERGVVLFFFFPRPSRDVEEVEVFFPFLSFRPERKGRCGAPL